jgi:hypothetical protein
MKITSILSKLIVEEQSRFQVLYDKLVAPSKKTKEGKPKKGLMTFDDLKQIIFADPTTRFPENFDIDGASIVDMEKVKVGKYTQWLLKNFVNPELNDEEKDYQFGTPEYIRSVARAREMFKEDLYKTTEDLTTFEKIKQHLPQDQRDINKFTIKSLFDTIDNFELPEKLKQKQEKNIVKKTRDGFNHAGGKIIHSGNDWTVIKIEDSGTVGKDAAIYYGGYQDSSNDETRWCTSAPGLTYFEGYLKGTSGQPPGPLYVILPNDDKGEVGKRTGLPKERYQFHFPSSQFMDRTDRQINLVDYLNGPMSEIKEIFRPEFARALTSGSGKSVEINYPQSTAAKYVALYGFEDLFETLPDDITELVMINSSNEEISLDIPPSIRRFKNLNLILLQKLVKSIPDEIGELQDLGYLGFPNNPNLTKLPESIANLNNLVFVNLRNSPNVKMSPKLLEILYEDNDGMWMVK